MCCKECFLLVEEEYKLFYIIMYLTNFKILKIHLPSLFAIAMSSLSVKSDAPQTKIELKNYKKE